MLRLENQPLEQTDNEQHDDIDWRQNGEDSDAEDGGAGAEGEDKSSNLELSAEPTIV